MQDALTPREMNITKAIGVVKFTKLAMKTYNSLCESCKAKIRQNPKLDINKFCNECRTKSKEIWGKYIEDEPNTN